MSVRSATTDETQPLLQSVTDEGQHVFANPPLENGADIPDTTIIDFDPGDAENPLEWAAPFKWTIVSMLAMMAFTVCVSIPPQPLAVPYY